MNWISRRALDKLNSDIIGTTQKRSTVVMRRQIKRLDNESVAVYTSAPHSQQCMAHRWMGNGIWCTPEIQYQMEIVRRVVGWCRCHAANDKNKMHGNSNANSHGKMTSMKWIAKMASRPRQQLRRIASWTNKWRCRWFISPEGIGLSVLWVNSVYSRASTFPRNVRFALMCYSICGDHPTNLSRTARASLNTLFLDSERMNEIKFTITRRIVIRNTRAHPKYIWKQKFHSRRRSIPRIVDLLLSRSLSCFRCIQIFWTIY